MGILNSITDSITLGVRGFMREIEKELTRGIFLRINRFRRRLIRDLTAIMIILIAMVFLAASISFLLIEYFHLSKTISFGVIGIILLLIGILIKAIR